jgi:replicative DNA helicase
MEDNKELCDSSASLYVISALMRDPMLIESDKYSIIQSDFIQPLQQIIFVSIYNLAKQGVNQILPSDIDLFLRTQPSQYEYYEQHKGYDWLVNAYNLTDQSDIKQFDFYYDRLKKFSILRDLVANGINIKDFYDLNCDFLDRDKQDEKLNAISLNDIINQVREKLVKIEDKHIGKTASVAQDASKGLRDLVNQLKTNPEIGLPLEGDILNYATRGARLGKFYVYSASSGSGKTRHMVGNACAISLPYIENHKIICREQLDKILFMATEMSADEIQTLILAHVSGVNEEKILLGTYTKDEEQDIKLALDIIDTYKDNFIIEAMPDPSIAAIKTRIIKHILQDNTHYIFYDYIFSSPGLLSEFRDLKVREDVALMMLSNSLKEIAMTYDVFIESATQLNGGWEDSEVRNQNLIRGSKAVADKIDIGMIGTRLLNDSQEYNSIKEILDVMPGQKKPNIVIDLYKNRRGKTCNVKIFRWFDYGTCRSQDLFITDTSYKKYTEENGKIGIVTYKTKAYSNLDEMKGEIQHE